MEYLHVWTCNLGSSYQCIDQEDILGAPRSFILILSSIFLDMFLGIPVEYIPSQGIEQIQDRRDSKGRM